MRPQNISGKRQQGYALILAMVVSTMLLVGAGSLLMVRQQWAYTASRSHQRDVASIALRNASTGFEETVRSKLISQQQLLFETTGASPFIETAVSANAGWADDFSIGTPTVSPSGTAVLRHVISGLDAIESTNLDPFNGLGSSTQTFDVSLSATQAGTAGVRAEETITTEIRQMPVSQFNLFSTGDLLLDRSYVEAGALGRVFANGSMGFTGGLFTANWLPVAAAGHLTFSSGGALSTPNTPSSGVSTSSNSVTAREWCSLSRGTYGMSMLAAPDGISPIIPNGVSLTALTANNNSNASLMAQCGVKVIVNPGSNLVVSDGVQTGAFQECSSVEGGVTKRYLVFNYSQVVGTVSSVYVIAPLTWKVVVYKARTLNAPLSIVTPNDLIIADGFNDLYSEGTAEKPASLITGGRIEAATASWAATLWK